MAESLRLGASIVHISNTGIALSTALEDGGALANRADSDIAGIAKDLKVTANVLGSIGSLFQNEAGDRQTVLSGKAQDVHGLTTRCKAIFGEIQQLVDERRDEGKECERSTDMLGRLVWTNKQERVELCKRRLESIKDSLLLMLHILHLANEEARGEMESSTLDQERQKIRELHQQEYDSHKALQALESKLNQAPLSDDSNAPSRVPTIDFLMNTPARSQSMSVPRNHTWGTTSISTAGYISDDSHTTDSDNTLTEDEDELLTAEELAQCATHVHRLMKRITLLQHSLERPTRQSRGHYSKNRVRKMYRRFCRKFEYELENRRTNTTSAAPFPGFQPSQIFDNMSNHTESANRGLASGQGNPISTFSATNEYHGWANNTNNSSGPTTGPSFPVSYPRRASTRDDHLPGFQSQQVRKGSAVACSAPKANVHREDSREGSKDGSQSGADRDVEQAYQGSASIHFTKTGRISKAKKGLKVHTCSECGKSFTRAEHLRRHQKNHGPDQVSCHLCGKVFFRADLLMRHVERHKDGPIVNTPAHGSQPSDSPGGHMPSHLSERPNDGTRRSSVSHNAENPQHWYYVWDETEKRYDVLYESKQKAPPTDHQLDSRMAPNPVQHSSSSPSLQPNTNAHQGPSYEGNARPPHHPNPLRREEFWRRSGKGGRTDGAAHPGPPSPMRSPPSPWIKDSRTLPPLRPSPSKASFSQTQDSTMVDVGVQPTSSPALQQPVPTLLAGILGHDSPYRNVGDSNSQKPRALFGPEHDHRRFQQGPNAVTVGAGKDGTSRSVPAHREQQLMVGRDGTHNEELHWRKATEDSQKEAANNVVDDLTRRSSVERASAGVKSSSFSRPPPAMHAPFQDERTPQTPLEATPRSLFTSDSLWSNARHPDGSKTFPLVSPVSIHPRSQPTSPSTSSTLRTYPNPIDPHRPAREQPLRRPSQNIESTADARKQDVVANISYPLLLPRVAKEARQRVKDKSEHSQDVEIVPSRKSSEQLTVEASAKRKMVEDGTQVEEAGREQSANASLPNSKRKKFEAEEGSARNSERTKVDGKQALVDTGGKVLLREHSEPTSLS